MKGIASSLITGVIIIAVLFVLVRPGSKGPTLVSSVSSGVKGLITAATGGGSWSKS